MLTTLGARLADDVPGLALFYGGMVRTKNVLSTFMHCFFALALVSVQWVALRLLARLRPDARRAHRRLRLLRLDRHPRHGERGGADDPAHALRDLPGDVRDHHAGAHLGRRSRSACKFSGVRRSSRCSGRRSSTTRSRTGCGATAAGSGEARRARLRRRHGRALVARRLGARRRALARQAARLSATPPCRRTTCR